MAAKRKPVVLVSSAVYGFEELLDRRRFQEAEQFVRETFAKPNAIAKALEAKKGAKP